MRQETSECEAGRSQDSQKEPSYCRRMRFETTIDVAAPVERVFGVYTEVEHWPDWTASVTSVERLDQGPLRVVPGPGSSSPASRGRCGR